jgi:hypothetical protein
MARLRGRAKRGERCRAPVPHGHWQTTTFTGALRLHGMTGPMNGSAFLTYVEQLLAPTVRRGDIVIMDMCGRPPWEQEESSGMMWRVVGC